MGSSPRLLGESERDFPAMSDLDPGWWALSRLGRHTVFLTLPAAQVGRAWRGRFRSRTAPQPPCCIPTALRPARRPRPPSRCAVARGPPSGGTRARGLPGPIDRVAPPASRPHPPCDSNAGLLHPSSQSRRMGLQQTYNDRRRAAPQGLRRTLLKPQGLEQRPPLERPLCTLKRVGRAAPAARLPDDSASRLGSPRQSGHPTETSRGTGPVRVCPTEVSDRPAWPEPC